MKVEAIIGVKIIEQKNINKGFAVLEPQITTDSSDSADLSLAIKNLRNP